MEELLPSFLSPQSKESPVEELLTPFLPPQSKESL